MIKACSKSCANLKAVVLLTIISRLVLFPFTVLTMRNSSRIAPYQPELTRIREEMAAAQKIGDQFGAQTAVLKQKAIHEMAGVKMGSMFVPPLIQIPVTIGMFLAVKRMCDLPVEQLKYSGFDMLPDLTVADPTYILPAVAFGLINLQLAVRIPSLAVQSIEAQTLQ